VNAYYEISCYVLTVSSCCFVSTQYELYLAKPRHRIHNSLHQNYLHARHYSVTQLHSSYVVSDQLVPGCTALIGWACIKLRWRQST